MSQGTEAKRPVSCPNCSKKLMAPPSWVGKKLKCPQCQKPFVCDFGQSTIETAQDRLRAKAKAVGPDNSFKAIHVESVKVDPKVEATRFFVGLLVAAAVCAALTLPWHWLNDYSGYVQIIPGFLVAGIMGLTMLFVSGKHGDILNSMVTAFMFIAVVGVMFWYLIAGGPEIIKPRVPDLRDAYATIVGKDELEKLNRGIPEQNAKWEEALARIRKEKVDAMSEATIDAELEARFDKTRREEVMLEFAKELALERDWPLENITPGGLFRDPQLIKDATEKAQKADIAMIRNKLAEEALQNNLQTYIEQEVIKKAAAEGIVATADSTVRTEWIEAAKTAALKMKPAQIDSAVRRNHLINGASPQKDAKPQTKGIALPPYPVVLLVAAAVVAGAGAFGWKRFG